MITAIDTNILLDILIPGEPFAPGSQALLEHHLERGALIVCEAVYAELASHFPSEKVLETFFADTGIQLAPSNEATLYLAGSKWTEYARKTARNKWTCNRCGNTFATQCPRCGASVTKRLHVLSDFLIGAHALRQADCLLSRDFGIYKTHFKTLKVLGAP